MPKDKRQVAIYKINTHTNGTSTLNALTENIKQKNGYHFTDLPVNPSKFQDYTAIALRLKKPFSTNWFSFLNTILVTPISVEREMNDSALLLLEHKITRNIYAATFGILGYYAIQEYIVEDFGIDILSHLVSPKEIQCKSTKAQSLVGTKQGETSVYRDFHLLEEMIDDFGKIFQELTTSIPKNKLEQFGIKTKEDSKRPKFCIAKDSFKINSSIQATDIEKILNGCEWALTQTQYPINAVKILANKKDKDIITKLNKQCIQNILKTFHQEEGHWNFDLCHKQYEKYLIAARTDICGTYSQEYEDGPLLKIQDLFNCLKKETPELDFTEETMQVFIEETKIITRDDEDHELTNDNIKKHLFDEEEIDNKKFFLLNGSWYQLEDSFLQDLNSRLKHLLQSYSLANDKFLLPWNSSSDEKAYINSHRQQNDSIIIHPHTVEHIELCDMMHWDNDNLYLYFIKQGFGNETRSLSSQVLLSASKIFREIKSEFDYLKKVYNKLTNLNRTSLSEVDFLKLFKKNIIVVFAFTDTSQFAGTRELKTNPDKFNSNIAKYSTLKLISELRNLDSITLKIHQIPN